MHAHLLTTISIKSCIFNITRD